MAEEKPPAVSFLLSNSWREKEWGGGGGELIIGAGQAFTKLYVRLIGWGIRWGVKG